MSFDDHIVDAKVKQKAPAAAPSPGKALAPKPVPPAKAVAAAKPVAAKAVPPAKAVGTLGSEGGRASERAGRIFVKN